MATENGPVVTRSAADFRMMRETLGLAQAWVARTVGVTTLTVVHWEDPREFALPRREAWDLVEGMWAEADRRAPAGGGLRGHGLEGHGVGPGQRHRTGAGDAVVLEGSQGP